MTDWEKRVNDIVEKMAREDQAASDAKQTAASLKEFHQERAEKFRQSTLMPALQRVKQLLDNKGGREVEISDTGPNAPALVVWKGEGPCKETELLIRFRFGTPDGGAQISAERSEGSVFLPVQGANGDIDKVSQENIVDSVMTQWEQVAQKSRLR